MRKQKRKAPPLKASIRRALLLIALFVFLLIAVTVLELALRG